MIKFKSKILFGIAVAFVVMLFTSSFTYAGIFADKSALIQKVNEQYTSGGNLKLSSLDYTSSTWNTYITNLNNARNVIYNIIASQSQVDNALANLNNAISGLVFAGQANLNAAKANANSKNVADYTTVTWQALVDALALPETTNTQVVAKTTAINNAISGLIFAGQADLDTAKSNANAKNSADYTVGTWQVLVDALAMPEATNAGVIVKTTAINNAISGLVFAGKANLDAAKLNVVTKGALDYTGVSWQVLAFALAMPETTNAEIVAKTTAINNALTGLVFAGQADLDNAISNAGSKNAADYTAISWQALVDALALPETSNAEVVVKTTAINDAITGLVFAGKADLDAAKSDASTKNVADYTVASWQVLTDALAMPETTNTEVVAKTTAINDAITGLVFAGQADLDTAKASANTKKQVDYTVNSFKLLTDALAMPETTNAGVVAKTTAINNAIKGLVFAGKANLDIAKVNSSNKKEVDYTVESWKILTDALAMKETTNAEVVAKTVAINNAINELKIMPVKYRVVPYVGLNCRVSPSINSKRVYAYGYGNIIEITEITNGWGKTKYGWVCMDYVSKFIPTVPLALRYKVTPYIGLNCRVAPDITSTKITAYKYGTMLEIFKIMNGWGNTNLGWVSMKYLKSI